MGMQVPSLVGAVRTVGRKLPGRMMRVLMMPVASWRLLVSGSISAGWLAPLPVVLVLAAVVVVLFLLLALEILVVVAGAR